MKLLMNVLAACFWFAMLGNVAIAETSLLNAEQTTRRTLPLRDGWTIQVVSQSSLDESSQVPTSERRPVGVDDSWESVLGHSFDGLAIYRVTLPQVDTENYKTWLLHIDGAATEATVRVNGRQIGKHLGGWTPFRLDVTEFLSSCKSCELEIEVDERVGHNTQGFLPIVVPHFGGVWKGVSLIGLPSSYWIDDLTAVHGGLNSFDQIQLQAAVIGRDPAAAESLELRVVVDEATIDSPFVTHQADDAPEEETPWSIPSGFQRIALVKQTHRPAKLRRWEIGNPYRYSTRFELWERSADNGEPTKIDSWTTWSAIRRFEVDGRDLKVNGKTVAVRGVLNWGYAPPRLAPSIDSEQMIAELNWAKSHGFNLMKFCLWIPPQEYLDLADQMGILTWVEYPTWHPDFSPKKLVELEREFSEFFYYDRNSPSVLLRSLTCETGPSADIQVIRKLYDRCHQLIPGAIVEDDSSWIQWNRVHDFYDDHPYGNNHSWRAKLKQLDQYIIEHGAKPLVLGEAIAADTWESIEVAAPHSSRAIGKQAEYIESLRSVVSEEAITSLHSDSLRYAWLMRKFQIEAFRGQFPSQGYVVSVLRDFPLASMGLIDRNGNSKWKAEEFQWHQEHMLVLKTDQDRRSYPSESEVVADLDLISSAGAPVVQLELLSDRGESLLKWESPIERIDSYRARSQLSWRMPKTEQPKRVTLVASCNIESGSVLIKNQWDLWVVPKTERRQAEGATLAPRIVRHVSASHDFCREIGLDEASALWDEASAANAITPNEVIVARTLDIALWEAIGKGAHVLMLPSGEPGSLALNDHWFLRGGPIAGHHPLWNQVPRSMLTDLQHFDWGGPVMARSPLASVVAPVAFLWDHHDLDHYRTHLLAFDVNVGKGRWMVTCLDHRVSRGAAGAYVLRAMIDELVSSRSATRSLEGAWIDRIRGELNQQSLSLANLAWRLQPDAENRGLELGWHMPSADRGDWTSIRIDRHWESQGFDSLDGWGWYQVSVKVPDEMIGKPLYLSFTGVDDYFEAYVDGEKVGSGGSIEKRETAFELRTSFPVPKKLSEDGSLDVVVRVFDWQGAGGLFRPVYLSTEPLQSEGAILVSKN